MESLRSGQRPCKAGGHVDGYLPLTFASVVRRTCAVEARLRYSESIFGYFFHGLNNMNKVKHLWNIVSHFSSNPAVEASGLQSYYIERCRQLEDTVELPKRTFGPGEMCSYCGSLWSKTEHRVRISRGRRMGQRVRKMIKKKENHKLGKIAENLVKRSTRNCDNKAMIRCSVCSKYTKLKFHKPKKLKKPELDESLNLNENQTPVVKKRKKRTKDKTAGLIITPVSLNKSLKTNPSDSKISPFNSKTSSSDSKTSVKVKRTNLNKLGAMIKKNLTPSKKSSLHDFISELGL